MALDIHPLTPGRWDDLVELFGDNGAYGNCWCARFGEVRRHSARRPVVARDL